MLIHHDDICHARGCLMRLSACASSLAHPFQEEFSNRCTNLRAPVRSRADLRVPVRLIRGFGSPACSSAGRQFPASSLRGGSLSTCSNALLLCCPRSSSPAPPLALGRACLRPCEPRAPVPHRPPAASRRSGSGPVRSPLHLRPPLSSAAHSRSPALARVGPGHAAFPCRARSLFFGPCPSALSVTAPAPRGSSHDIKGDKIGADQLRLYLGRRISC
jgi:hypothetical protein